MLNIKSKFRTRVLIAAVLLALSVLSSVLISLLSNQRESYWIAEQDLTPGQQIAASDITKVEVNINPISGTYLSVSENPIGSIVLNRIPRFSLLANQSISSRTDSINSAELSLTIRANDLPAKIAAGDRISIYQVEDVKPGDLASAPNLILADIYLGSIERKSTNFGSDAAITIAIGRNDISDVLRSTTFGRLVVVKLNG